MPGISDRDYSPPAGYRRQTRSECEPVRISAKEHYALRAALELAIAGGGPLTREQLLQATRVHEDIFDRSVDVQVFRLRRKLESDACTPRIIQTERGAGYMFAARVEPF